MGNCSSSTTNLIVMTLLISLGFNVVMAEVFISDLLSSLSRTCHIVINGDSQHSDDQMRFIKSVQEGTDPVDITASVEDFRHFSLGDRVQLVIEDQHEHLVATEDLHQYDFLILKRKLIDRSCLMKPDLLKEKVNGVVSSGCSDLQCFVDMVNNHCDTYLTKNGETSKEGLAVKQLLAHRYDVNGHSITLEELVERCGVNGSLK